MQNTWNTGLTDRRKASSDAKKALFEKFRTKTAEPELAAKLAEREAIAAAREERLAERERQKAQEREALLAAEAEAARLAELAANEEANKREAADRERIARVFTDQAAAKALRDKRYAERKARGRG